MNFSEQVGAALPYLRRYARALTGNQTAGDNYAAATLEAILEDRTVLEEANSVKSGLFKCFHSIWGSSGAALDEDVSPSRARAHDLLSRLTPNSREVLLLRTIEDFSLSDIAEIMSTDVGEVRSLLEIAQREMADKVTGNILIIEDEAIISADLTGIVELQGHSVIDVARTRDEAMTKGAKRKPDLILADIQLADNSSGIDAVNDLLAVFGNVPVIFITAFPERLLTGERPEPAFLISKPYREEQVRSAVSQAMFFASTETLKS
ncbi:response regulator [Litoreibacter arenae]|uniref:DNA-directed RNA polymerase specialized sigma subunit n=1 Tax=Litoreibacter arenae DSM 19593 TaxID=1123360 RepID=S9QI08_9RHOB|nr:response regulator [Litoreibacter arenae]EPX79467.1 DNA-directed RNA polymerase specialized sigma subunit [Litoreibacter arenae DSM 19593]